MGSVKRDIRGQRSDVSTASGSDRVKPAGGYFCELCGSRYKTIPVFRKGECSRGPQH